MDSKQLLISTSIVCAVVMFTLHQWHEEGLKLFVPNPSLRQLLSPLTDCEEESTYKDKIRCLYRERLSHLTAACKKYLSLIATDSKKLPVDVKELARITLSSSSKRLWFSTKSNFEFCRMEKVASRTLAEMICNATGVRKDSYSRPKEFSVPPGFQLHKGMLTHVSQYDRIWYMTQLFYPDENEEKFLSFIFVRDPMSKIISSYNSKLKSNNSWSCRSGSLRESLISDNCSTSELSPEYYLNHLLRFSSEPQSLNVHFKPMYLRCSYCSRPPDVLAKLETFEADRANILEHFNITQPPRARKVGTTATPNSTKEFLSHVRCSLLQQVFKLYRLDFELFDYDSDKYLAYCKQDM